MNAFKRYARRKGLKLDCDFECLPWNGVDCVVTISNRAQVSAYHYGAGWAHWVFDRGGKIVEMTRDQINAATRAAVECARR